MVTVKTTTVELKLPLPKRTMQARAMIKRWCAMNESARETRKEAVRTKGIQDDEAGLFTRLIFSGAKRRYGHVPLSTRIRANDWKLLAIAELMGRYTSARGTCPPKLKELVQLKVAAMVGCPL